MLDALIDEGSICSIISQTKFDGINKKNGSLRNRLFVCANILFNFLFKPTRIMWPGGHVDRRILITLTKKSTRFESWHARHCLT